MVGKHMIHRPSALLAVVSVACVASALGFARGARAESPDGCVDDPTVTPAPFERLVAPPGSLWWVNQVIYLDEFDGSLVRPPATLLGADDRPVEAEQTSFPYSVAVRAPADAALGSVFTLRFQDESLTHVVYVQLTVGDAASLSSAATIDGAVAVARHTPICRCEDGGRDVVATMTIRGGPAILDASPTGGFFFQGDGDAPETITFVAASFQDSVFDSGVRTVELTLRDPETLEILDALVVDLAAREAPEVAPEPEIRHCMPSIGCSAGSDDASRAVGFALFAGVLLIGRAVAGPRRVARCQQHGS